MVVFLYGLVVWEAAKARGCLAWRVFAVSVKGRDYSRFKRAVLGDYVASRRATVAVSRRCSCGWIRACRVCGVSSANTGTRA